MTYVDTGEMGISKKVLCHWGVVTSGFSDFIFGRNSYSTLSGKQTITMCNLKLGNDTVGASPIMMKVKKVHSESLQKGKTSNNLEKLNEVDGICSPSGFIREDVLIIHHQFPLDILQK